jgi:hypothetical protein
MTSFGIKNEGGRLLFPRLERGRSSEAVARLIASVDAPTSRLAELSVMSNVGSSSDLEARNCLPSGLTSTTPGKKDVDRDDNRKFKRQRREQSLKAAASASKFGGMPTTPGGPRTV